MAALALRTRTASALGAGAAALLLLAAGSVFSPACSSQSAHNRVSVIVRELPGSGDAPERLVERLGGSVRFHIRIIDGFAAELPTRALEAVEAARDVGSVTLDRQVQLLNELDGWDNTHDGGSMYSVAQAVTGAAELWNDGWTGRGVDVALIDSGVLPVNGLRTPGKVIQGPDLSFESQAESKRHLDSFGHGTHVAGIIAGRDDAVPELVQKGEERFVGMAPDARIVSVKVADGEGATDVSQVLAAIDWVVQHRHDRGLNIRVLNLSFGTDSVQDYRVDPLAYAAEVAWRKGIVVVAAAGNGGPGKLDDPAYDPYVLAVGAADGNGTYGSQDDTVPAWSASGDGHRGPSLHAPGWSIGSLGAPGSAIDFAHPGARIGSRFFRGSGTSQAAAVVSGAAALLLQQRPWLTPDRVKALLVATASPLAAGAAMLDLKAARDAPAPETVQAWARSAGTGSLELARGSRHVSDEGVELRGEQDIFGTPWDGARWSNDSMNEAGWTGGSWNGNAWSGDAWSGDSWSAKTWSAKTWSGGSWSTHAWGR